MNKSADLKRSKTFWLVTVGSTVFMTAILAVFGFAVYEFQLYGRSANNFPKANLEAMLNKTGEEIDTQGKTLGYRQLNNPFFGKHALAIDAPKGSWLVSFEFGSNGKATRYSVLYSNVDSLIYHNAWVKK